MLLSLSAEGLANDSGRESCVFLSQSHSEKGPAGSARLCEPGEAAGVGPSGAG